MPGVEDMRRGFGTIHRFDYGVEVGIVTIMEIGGEYGIALHDEDREPGQRFEDGEIGPWLHESMDDIPNHTIEEDE